MRMRPACLVYPVIVGLACTTNSVTQEPSGLRQLTDDPAQDGFPQWSPDGESIVFSRYGGEEAPDKNGLWVISPDG